MTEVTRRIVTTGGALFLSSKKNPISFHVKTSYLVVTDKEKECINVKKGDIKLPFTLNSFNYIQTGKKEPSYDFRLV